MCEGRVFLGLCLSSWGDFGGLVAAVALVPTILAIGFAAWQAREAARSRRLELIARLIEVLGAEDKRRDRAVLYRASSRGVKYSDLRREHREAIERAIVSFDLFAALSKLDLLNRKELVIVAGDVVKLAYPKAEMYFDDIRRISEQPRKGEDFKRLFTLVLGT